MDTNFENKYTLLYKQVPVLKSPVRYIASIENEYHSFEELINYYPDLSLDNLKDFFIDSAKSIMNIINAYFYFSYSVKEDKDLLFEEVNNFIHKYNIDNQIDNPNWVNIQEFDSINTLIDEAKKWYKGYQKEYAQDLKKFKKMIDVQDKLRSLEVQKVTNIETKSYIFECVPKVRLENERNKKLVSIDVSDKTGILIFNELKALNTVPYIKLYNYDNKEYHKVYESDTFRDIGKIIINRKLDKINYLYFIVLINNDYESTADTSYTEVEYDLNCNKIRFKCKSGNEDEILRRLQNCFKGFQFTSIGSLKKNIEVSMNVVNFKLEPSVLHFLFFNEEEQFPIPLFSTYFFIDESDLSIADRDNIVIKYKSIMDDEDESSNASSATIRLIQVKDNLQIEITKGKNEDIIVDFIEIFSRILTYYLEIEESITASLDYVAPFGEVQDTREKRTRVKIKDTVFEKKIDQLRDLSADPDIFKPSSEGYSRRCNCQKQPIIVEEDEFEDWKNKTFIDHSDIVERQIGNFPPNSDEPLFNYTCPDDEFPYPTVIENKDPSTNKKYPHLPCCSKTDTINNPKSEYNQYGNVKEDKSSVNKNYKIKSFKTLDWSRTAEININIQNILNSNVLEEEKTKYERFGVGKSTNTLIHCVLTAVKEKTYTNLDIKDKEDYCISIRKEIIDKLPNYYELVRQENYNQSKESLTEYINDNNKFFDSAKLYRLLEELYNVNIFVFDSSTNGVEIPSNALVHIRPYNSKRKSVIIIKYESNETEKICHTVYDLVFNTNTKLSDTTESTNPRILLHGSRVSELMYNIFNKYIENFVINIDNNTIQTRLRPYSVLYWPEILKRFDIIEQDLDSYGKLRSINVKLKKSELAITLFVPPNQPLDCPQSSTINVNNPDVIKSIFGEPYKIINGGFWYSVIDYEYGIFIPCDIKSTNFEPISPVIEQITTDVNPVFEYRKVQKDSKLLIDFIIWGLRSNNILNYKDYIENNKRYIKSNPKVRPNISPIKNVSYLTNKGNFSYLSIIWPEYFYTDNTVQLYPSLYDKVIGYLKRYYTETDGLSLPPDPYIKDIFNYEWDFKTYNQNRVLIGNTHLKRWTDIHKKKFKGSNQIVLELKPELLDTEEPFLYHDTKTMKMYLVQTVSEGSMKRAVSCSAEWRKTRTNLGHYISDELYDISELEYVVYNISPTYSIIESEYYNFEDETITDYLCVLEYNNNYIALLEIF